MNGVKECLQKRSNLAIKATEQNSLSTNASVAEADEIAEPTTHRVSFFDWISSPRALQIVVWAGLAGMALILLSSLFEKPADATATAAAPAVATAAEEYATSMEGRLREMLLCVQGVSDCRVMVTLENGGRTVYQSGTKEPLTECRPTVRGVVVVIHTTTGEAVRDEVCRVVKTALHLAEKRVCVVVNTAE